MTQCQFEDIIEELKPIAKNLSIKCNKVLEPDELINEAWIKSTISKRSTKKQIKIRAVWDMRDHIRNVIGGKGRTKKFKLITNVGKTLKKTNIFFDRETIDNNLKRLEDKELLIKLLMSCPTKRQLEAIKLCYFEGKTIKEAGNILGTNSPTISKLLSAGRKKCKEQLELMDI